MPYDKKPNKRPDIATLGASLLADKRSYSKKNDRSKDDMKDLKFVKATTDTGFKRDTFIYNFMSSMRQKINDPLNKRAEKQKEISQR